MIVMRRMATSTLWMKVLVAVLLALGMSMRWAMILSTAVAAVWMWRVVLGGLREQVFMPEKEVQQLAGTLDIVRVQIIKEHE